MKLSINVENIKRNDFTIGNYYLAVGFLHNARKWEDVINVKYGGYRLFHNQRNIDDIVLDDTAKEREFKKAKRLLCKALFNIKAIDSFLKTDKEGNYIGQDEVYAAMNKYIDELHIDLDSMNCFKEANYYLG